LGKGKNIKKGWGKGENVKGKGRKKIHNRKLNFKE
jgi:hypothetical protein